MTPVVGGTKESLKERFTCDVEDQILMMVGCLPTKKPPTNTELVPTLAGFDFLGG